MTELAHLPTPQSRRGLWHEENPFEMPEHLAMLYPTVHGGHKRLRTRAGEVVSPRLSGAGFFASSTSAWRTTTAGNGRVGQIVHCWRRHGNSTPGCATMTSQGSQHQAAAAEG
jgi:hypothetical protein